MFTEIPVLTRKLFQTSDAIRTRTTVARRVTMLAMMVAWTSCSAHANDWKTNKDENLGIQMDCPSSWRFEEMPAFSEQGGAVGCYPADKKGVGVNITASFSTERERTLNEFLTGLPEVAGTKKELVTFGGRNAVRISRERAPAALEYIVVNGKETWLITFNSADARWKSNVAIFRHAADSFRFTRAQVVRDGQ